MQLVMLIWILPFQYTVVMVEKVRRFQVPSQSPDGVHYNISENLMENQITDSPEHDLALFRNHTTSILNVLAARRARREQAVQQHLGAAFSSPSKFTLPELQSRLAHYQDLYDRTDKSNWLQKKTEIQTLIDNNDYAVEGTPEWTYRQNKDAQCATFIWPTEAELLLQEQEKQQLLALLTE